MSGVAGIELIYAAKKATTWGTAIAAGALNGFLSRPSGIKESQDTTIDDSLGLFFPGDGAPGAIKVEGDLPAYLRYDGLDLLIYLAMGTVAARAANVGFASAYDYTYKPAKNTDGLFATFVKHMKNYIAEVPSLKITGFTIKGEVGKPVEFIIKTIGNRINKNTSTGTNTLTTANSITIAETANRLMFGQAVFRMNDASGIALASPTHVINPSGFELTFQRKLTGVYGSNVTGGTNSQDLIDEPTNDGMPEVTLKLQFPRHTGVTYLTDLGNDTRKKMDITFTGALIGGTANRSFKIQMPHLQYKSVDITDEQGIIKEPLEFNVYTAAAAPTGMTGITDPLWISGTNTLAANP
jgi:hypothetical protein